jgi:hypothetical protein
MKVPSKVFRGIEYIQLSHLPQAQREKLLETLNQNLFIKILIDGKILSDCLQYKDYTFWYENVYHIDEKSSEVGDQPKTTKASIVVR